MNRILVVDDEKSMRQLLGLHLGKEGYEIDFAENGKQAVAQTLEKRPNLILMDLRMPIMDGLEATNAIREHYQPNTLPIIIVSADSDRKEHIRALQAGANDFVSKPYNKTELIARIEINLTINKLSNELSEKNSELQKREARSEQEKKLAGEVQYAVLPHNPKFPGFSIQTLYKPSTHMGGDFFDFFQNGDDLFALIGDVSGHGIPAALIMTAAKSVIHSLGEISNSPKEIITNANKQLCEMLGNHGIFLTLVLAKITPKTDQMEVISAGHNPVYLLNKQNVIKIDSSGTFLGWDDRATWDSKTFSFQDGDTLFMYTDGLVEVENNDGEQFGDQKLLEIIEQAPPQKQLELALNASMEFCQEHITDDITIFTIQKEDQK